MKKNFNLFPAIASAMSKGLADRIIVMGSKSVRGTKPEDKQQTSYGHSIESTGSASITGSISHKVPEEPGVGGLIAAIHAMDSVNISDVYKDYEGLNIFDAFIYSLNDVEAGTTVANKGFYEINKNYSVISEVYKSLINVLTLNRQTNRNKDLNKAIHDRGQKRAKEINKAYKPETIQDILEEVKELKEVTEKNRTEIFTRIVSVNQFGFPNAVHQVPFVAAKQSQETQIKNEIDNLTQHIKEEYILTGKEPGSPDVLNSEQSMKFDLKNFQATYAAALNHENSTEIFENVATMGNKIESPVHQAHLRGVLGNLVNTVLIKLDTKEIDLKINEEGEFATGAYVPEGDAVRIRTGAHVGPGVVHNSSELSTQEVLVHELVHAVTKYGIDHNSTIRRQIQQLFNEVKGQITVEDFLPDTYSKADKEAAQIRMDYIFNSKNALHEFVAFGLTNQKFIAKLATIKPKQKRDLQAKTYKERLYNLYLNILDYVTGKINGTHNLTADKALMHLTENLVGINTKYQISFLKYLDSINTLSPYYVGKLMGIIFKPMNDYHDSLVKKQLSKEKVNKAEHLFIGA